MLSEAKVNSADCQFIRMGNFLLSSTNKKLCTATIFGYKPPLQSGGIALSLRQSLRGSVQIYQVSEAHTYTLVDIFSLVGSHKARAD